MADMALLQREEQDVRQESSFIWGVASLPYTQIGGVSVPQGQSLACETQLNISVPTLSSVQVRVG